MLTVSFLQPNFFIIRTGSPTLSVEKESAVRTTETARTLGIQDGDWVWVETCENRTQMRAKRFNGMAPDAVRAQHAWGFPEEGPPEYGWKRSNVN